jgi:hypothetical protein
MGWVTPAAHRATSASSCTSADENTSSPDARAAPWRASPALLSISSAIRASLVCGTMRHAVTGTVCTMRWLPLTLQRQATRRRGPNRPTSSAAGRADQWPGRGGDRPSSGEVDEPGAGTHELGRLPFDRIGEHVQVPDHRRSGEQPEAQPVDDGHHGDPEGVVLGDLRE